MSGRCFRHPLVGLMLYPSLDWSLKNMGWVSYPQRRAAGSKQTLRQSSRPPSEDASGSKPAASRIVGAEQAAEHFASHIEALDVLFIAVENPAVGV